MVRRILFLTALLLSLALCCSACSAMLNGTAVPSPGAVQSPAPVQSPDGSQAALSPAPLPAQTPESVPALSPEASPAQTPVQSPVAVPAQTPENTPAPTPSATPQVNSDAQIVLMTVGEPLFGQSDQVLLSPGDIMISAYDMNSLPAKTVADTFTRSQSLTSENWLALSSRINALLASDSVDGLVLILPLENMEETAYFLTLTVRSTKPVIVTGAFASADAQDNVLNALRAAASPVSKGCGVLLCQGQKLFTARDAVLSEDGLAGGQAGQIDGSGAVSISFASARTHTANSRFDLSKINGLPQVSVACLYTGSGAEPVRRAVSAGDAGVVLMFNGKTMPADLSAYLKTLQNGPVFVASASMIGGRVQETNTVSAGDLTPGKARVLLMLSLTQTTDTNEIANIFLTY